MLSLKNIWERLLLVVLKRFIELLKDFVFKWIFIIFFNFLLWTIYHGNTSWAMHLLYIWLSWQGKKQSSTTTKINRIKTHCCDLETLAYSYKFSSLFIMKSLLNVNLKCFHFTRNSVICAKSPMGLKFFFSQWKTYFFRSRCTSEFFPTQKLRFLKSLDFIFY